MFFIASIPCYIQSAFMGENREKWVLKGAYVYSYTYDCDLVDHKSLHRSGSLSTIVDRGLGLPRCLLGLTALFVLFVIMINAL